MIAKRRYKVRVLSQSTPFIPTSAAPAPVVATVSTQTPSVRSTAESVPVTVCKLAMGQFAEVPCPTTRPQNEKSYPPPLEDIPNAPPRQSTPWPNTGSASENWLIPHTPVSTSAPTIKTEEQSKVAAIPHAMVMPKHATEESSWGLHYQFVRMRKSMKKTGMAIGRTNQECSP